VVNDFLTASTQPLARLFQEIVSLAPDGSLGIDHQKLLVQVFQLQKVAHSAVLLQKFKYLYNSVVRLRLTPQELEEGVEKPREEMGLGIKETIELYGYGYPKLGLINWIELNFANSYIAERFPYPSHALTNITARPNDRWQLNDLFQAIDFVIGRLRTETDEEAREVLLDWLAATLVKQFHIDLMIYMINGPFEFANKERHAKKLRDDVDDESETSDNDSHGSTSAVNNGKPLSSARNGRRAREDIDSDYEGHSSESEVS
jgi:hypothetical protein